MKHLVTGSKGFLGAHLMRALREEAVGLDLPECNVLLGDNEFGLRRELFREPVDTFWHLAALNGSTAGFYDRPWEVLDTQIRGTLNVIDACIANGVKTLVLFSSSEVFQEAKTPTPEAVPFSIPDPANPRFAYAGGKQASELLAWWSPIPKVIVIRPFNIFGDDQKPGHVIADLRAAIRALQDGEALQVKGNPNDSRAYCHVSDFIAGCLAINERHKSDERCREVYNIGNPANWYTNHQLAELLLREGGRSGALIKFGDRMPGAPQHRCPDVSKLRALGWEPEVRLG